MCVLRADGCDVFCVLNYGKLEPCHDSCIPELFCNAVKVLCRQLMH